MNGNKGYSSAHAAWAACKAVAACRFVVDYEGNGVFFLRRADDATTPSPKSILYSYQQLCKAHLPKLEPSREAKHPVNQTIVHLRQIARQIQIHQPGKPNDDDDAMFFEVDELNNFQDSLNYDDDDDLLKVDQAALSMFGSNGMDKRDINSLLLSASNVYEQDVRQEEAGGWGGYCTCPNGERYAVGDLPDTDCGSLACVGGIAGKCNEDFGEWSHNKVTCYTPSLPVPALRGRRKVPNPKDRLLPPPCARCRMNSLRSCRVECLRAGIAARRALLEAKIGPDVLGSCTASLAGLTQGYPMLRENVLANEPSLSIAVVGGSNTAGGGSTKGGLLWPMLLERNLRWLFDGVKQIDVRSSANGGTNSEWATLARAQQVNGSSRIVLWEYALNDFASIQYADEKRSTVEYWIEEMARAFPYSTFGFVFLDDGSNWQHKSPVHCASEAVAKRKLREYSKTNGTWVEMFGLSTCDYQRHYERRAKELQLKHKRGLNEERQTAFDHLWDVHTQHLHDRGNILLAEIVEYALIDAVRQAISPGGRAASNNGTGAAFIPPTSWRPSWDHLLSLPYAGEPGSGKTAPEAAKKKLVVRFATPSWGVFPDMTVQCSKKEAPQRISEVLGGARGCMQVRAVPGSSAEVALENKTRSWSAHSCRVLHWYKERSLGRFISGSGPEQRSNEQVKQMQQRIHELHLAKADEERLLDEAFGERQKCDMSGCPSCLVISANMDAHRNDAKLSLFLQKEHLCKGGSEALRIDAIPFRFTHVAFHTAPMEHTIKVRFCAHNESDTQCARKTESSGEVWYPNSMDYASVHGAAEHPGGRLLVCLHQPQLNSMGSPNAGITGIDFIGIQPQKNPSASSNPWVYRMPT
jgi:hypothetical protein